MKPVFEEIDESGAVGLQFQPEVDSDEDGQVDQTTFILPLGILIDEKSGEALGEENTGVGAKTEMAEDLIEEKKQASRTRESMALRLRDTIPNTSDQDIVRLTPTELMETVLAAKDSALQYVEALGLEATEMAGRLVSELTEHVITGGDRTDTFVGAARQLNCVECLRSILDADKCLDVMICKVCNGFVHCQ